jgi:hypothetical protein
MPLLRAESCGGVGSEIMAKSNRRQTALDLVGPVNAQFDQKINLPALAFARALAEIPGISSHDGDGSAPCTCH